MRVALIVCAILLGFEKADQLLERHIPTVKRRALLTFVVLESLYLTFVL